MTLNNTNRVRTARLDGFTVSLYDLGVKDSRGTTALGYRIIKGGKVLTECSNPRDAVYPSPLHADDSDATMASAINLICYVKSHDKNDRPISCDWARDLDEASSLRWPDL
jgi:hypothetical protein